MADSGFGQSITFASGFFAEILSIQWSGISRDAIATTSSGTSGGSATFIPSDIEDYGEVQVELLFDPDDTPPIASAAESVTVTWPIPAGLTNGATWAFSGFMTSFEVNSPIDDRMTATATIKVSGIITFTDAS